MTTGDRPRLLDLFCGAGGASQGYALAGFDVVGVDHRPQPRYVFGDECFIQADAMDYVAAHGHEYDAIHASPPCQAYTVGQHIHDSGDRHVDLVGPVRDLLESTGRPWVIENVVNAPLRHPATLCGLMFGLRVLRHRLFEASFLLLSPPHPKHPEHLRTGTLTSKRGGRGNGYSTGEQGLVCVAGHNFKHKAGSAAMSIDWMTRKELTQAIPPAYTRFVGGQLMEHAR